MVGFAANAQFEKGTQYINGMVGLGWSYKYNDGDYNTRNFPAISFSYERGFFEVEDAGIVSLGIMGGWNTARYKFKNDHFDAKYSWNTWFFGAMGNIYFTEFDFITDPNLQLYAGLALGGRIVSADGAGTYPAEPIFDAGTSVKILLNVHAGAKYFFSDHWAGFVELGYGTSYINFGITYKL